MGLFMSKREKEKEAAKQRRKAFRDAESAVDNVKDKIAKLKKERDRSWAEARQYLKDGQKAAAQRQIQSVRAAEVMMGKMEMKRWVFEQLLVKLDMAKTDQDFTGALTAINMVVKIDPEAVADVLGEVEDKLGEQVDTDKIWEGMHTKQMEGAEGQMQDTIPTVDDLLSQLSDEVAVDVGTKRKAKSVDTESAEPSAKQQISEGRRRLKNLLDGEK